MVKIVTLIGAVAGLFLLGGCETTHIGDQLGQIERGPAQRSAFGKDLHKEYIG